MLSHTHEQSHSMDNKILGKYNNENLFLVGFSNSKRTDVIGLGLIDASSGEYSWVDTGDRGGFAGLALDERYLYALFQIMPGAGLVIADRQTGRALFRKVLAEVVDEHSLVVENDYILVVSTGTDSVLRYDIKKEGENIIDVVFSGTVWSPADSDKTEDTHHVNCIVKTSKGVCVSGFGKKQADCWSSAREGYIWNISTDSKVSTKAIQHPHSVVEHKGDIYYCESATCTVKKNEEPLIFLGSGYVRGLAVTDKYIVVGVSQGRKVSKSTGVVNKSEDVHTADCAVHVYCKNTLGLLRTLDFAGERNEIYDILSVYTD